MLLQDYLDDQDVAIAAFAKRLGVSVQTVYRYLNGERLPRRDVMERIAFVTGGRVQPNDFFFVPLKPA